MSNLANIKYVIFLYLFIQLHAMSYNYNKNKMQHLFNIIEVDSPLSAYFALCLELVWHIAIQTNCVLVHVQSRRNVIKKCKICLRPRQSFSQIISKASEIQIQYVPISPYYFWFFDEGKPDEKTRKSILHLQSCRIH